MNKSTLRKIYNSFNRKRLKNTEITLIASNCNGCCILNDLGLRFNSPFVNLWVEPAEFVRLCGDLENYMRQELQFLPSTPQTLYPVALLGDVKLYFQHYDSEAAVREAWDHRKARMDFDHLYFLFTDHDGCTEQDLQQFDQLEAKHKAVLCHKPHPDIRSAVYIRGFEEKPCIGMSMRYRSKFSIRKYYDDFDYVAWFNEL